MDDFRICRNYSANIEDHPELVGEECLRREGKYYSHEYDQHFSRTTGAKTCKHCFKQKRFVSDNTYDPVITRNWPRDENGRLLSYWHVIEKNVILKVESE